MLSTSQISVFFNRQYLINGLTSYFDFLNVDGREWKEQGLLMGFPKKINLGQIGYFVPENDSSSELFIYLKDFFEILYYENGQEVHENNVNGFSEKKMLIWGTWHVLKTLRRTQLNFLLYGPDQPKILANQNTKNTDFTYLLTRALFF